MTSAPSRILNPAYRPDIDGLRAVAVLSVVAFHAFPSCLKGGFIGVDVFFVISGFLISTILFENLERGTFSFKEFYLRRIRRIFPALSLVLFACLLFGWFSLLPDELNQLGRHVVAGTGSVSNLVLWGESGYFDVAADTKPLLHLWSLGIEEQFYLVWPCLLWLAWKRHLAFPTVTALLAAASFVLNVWMVHRDPVAAFYAPWSRFWELLCGALLARYSFRRPGGLPAASGIHSILGTLLLVSGLLYIDKDLRFPGHWALVPVVGTVLVILAGPQAWLNRKVLSHKVLVWFGLLSFPLYLWHWPLLSFGRIVYFDVPPPRYRLAAVLVAIVLAWLTMKFVERPFRFGVRNSALRSAFLCGSPICLALAGVVLFESGLSDSRSIDTLRVKRRGQYAIGSSLAWYRGKGDWLFLGNAYDDTVAKLELASRPSREQIDRVWQSFSRVAETGARYGARTVLIVGPEKSSVYPECLPEGLIPSPVRYSSFFLDRLRGLPGLTVYDPTDDFLAAKESAGLLYWMTDTHWNDKGAYLAYAGFSRLLHLPRPRVEFRRGPVHKGDLLGISRLKDFPLHPRDNWNVVWKDPPAWTRRTIPGEPTTPFGDAAVVTNEKSLANQYVWVVGDSFAVALMQYFNATFRSVRYVGHWANRLNHLSEDLDRADRKPDLIVFIRAERSF